MDVACKSDQMVPATMDSGEMVWPTGTADSSTLKETSTKESGLKTKQTGMESTPISMEVDMRANGSRINSMASVSSSGLMELSTKDSMNRA